MDEKKSPNDHYLIPHLTLFSKITRAELGAEGQRYETKTHLLTGRTVPPK